jgi:4'-phosphopantetheinyl transferase
VALGPEEWRFSTGPRGQPSVLGAPVDLRFSLSHAGGRAAVAVTVGCAVGLDLQEIDAATDALAVAGRFFTPAELEMLRACEGAERTGRFTTLWTVKEAVLKARGGGLASGLATAAVRLDGSGRLLAVSAPDGPWSVRAWEPEHGLHAALALATEAMPPILISRAVPLGGDLPAPELEPPER